jgi:DNA-binding protein HU-beta
LQYCCLGHSLEEYAAKEELIEKVASGARLSKADATRAINTTIGSITSALRKSQSVTLVGFGTFKVSKRKARKGRNPRTGEIITIKATKVPKFSAGKSLKEAVK